MKLRIQRRVIEYEEEDSTAGRILWWVGLSCGHTKTGVGGNQDQLYPPKTTRCIKCEKERDNEFT